MHDKKNIVLTGFMGTGKSTVGRSLAKLLSREWVDTDELIESKYGSIQVIFATEGEAHFRSLERHLACELAGQTGLVISTGGKMLLDAEVRRYLEPVSRIFCLVASPETILHRAGGQDGAAKRPLLAGPDTLGRIVELLTERSTGYAGFESIDTDGKTTCQVAQEIAQLVVTP